MNPDLLKTDIAGRLTLGGRDLIDRCNFDLSTSVFVTPAHVCVIGIVYVKCMCVLRSLNCCFSQLEMRLFSVRFTPSEHRLVTFPVIIYRL